jgi:hypothetical protein
MKLDRAGEHLDSLRTEVLAYRATKPISVIPDKAPIDGRLAYRLHYVVNIPSRIKVILADLLNNLRVATENLAFELARLSHEVPLTAEQEAESTFPICVSPQAFNQFFLKPKRVGLYGDSAREAFRLVQPYVLLDQMQKLGLRPDETYDEHARWDELYRLNKVWNIDKHRRQPGLMWWPESFWWSSHGPSNRMIHLGDRSLDEGSVIFYVEGEDDGMGTEVNSEFNLCFTDDPAFAGVEGAKHDVLDLVEGWYQKIKTYIFPMVYTVMSRSAPAPMSSTAQL